MQQIRESRTIKRLTMDGKFELFERFEADLSIDAVMPRYPGNLDLYMEIAAFSGNIKKFLLDMMMRTTSL